MMLPGISQKDAALRDPARFAHLDDPAVAARLISFDDGRRRAGDASRSRHPLRVVRLAARAALALRARRRARRSRPARRTVRVEFRSGEDHACAAIAEASPSLGYEPAITAEDGRLAQPPARRRLYLQLGVAGFAFGNIMLFSIPRYANGAPARGRLSAPLRRAERRCSRLPVLLFSASDYFRVGLARRRERGVMALDVPVALGLAVLFGRSVVDIATGRGEGFMDSFAGLVFFLLIGRLFQQKAFDRIAFDRTFRSFLPLSVQRRARDGGPVPVPIEQLRAGRSHPRCGRRRSSLPTPCCSTRPAIVDYAFITGEQTPVAVDARRDACAPAAASSAGPLRLRVQRDVIAQPAGESLDQSGLRQAEGALADATCRRASARWFTVGAIGLAAAGAVAWWPDAAQSAQRRHGRAHHRLPVRADAVGADHARHRDGLLGTRGLYLKHRRRWCST